MESVNICPICLQNPEPRSLKTIAQGYGCAELGFHYEVSLCANCDLAFTYPKLEELASLYADRTSNDFHAGDTSFSKRIKSWWVSQQAGTWVRMLDTRPSVVADIGCGDGRFTSAVARILGAQTTVYGIDFHDTPPPALQECRYARYLPFSRIGELKNSCDLLVLRHSLEHTNDPVAMLKNLGELLRPGGKIMIEVPNRRSPFARIFGKHYHLWYVPYHRVHFSRQSLEMVVRRAGFHDIRISGAEEPTMARSLSNVLAMKHNFFFFLIGVALHPLQMAVGLFSGEPTALLAKAVKPGGA